MSAKMNQSMKQTQSLAMTPQLQQAIKLLTLTHMEMTDLIASEMVENPMLEEIEPSENNNEKNEEAVAADFNGPEMVEGGKEQFDWESYVDSYNNSSSSAPSTREHISSDDMPSYENMISKDASLQEHLEWQLRMESLDPDKNEFATRIIHSLNDEGYLDVPLADLVGKLNLDADDQEDVLKIVQNFDPVGCAARNLQECLLIQATALEQRMPLVETMIERFFEDLQKKNYDVICKKLAVSLDSVKQAELVIHALHPRPGRLVSPEEIHYVTPDIFVKEVAGEFVVVVNDEGVPRLKVSKLYRSLIENKESSTKEAQDYVQDKLRAALWLIKSIENRQKTIFKVAEAIVRQQQEFFRMGPSKLKPMILKDIANEIGMHESTVSRVTTNKYMHTPIGTLEMKYFFSCGIGGKNGGIDIAGESLKMKIKKLIDSESPKKPLSDQKIVDILADESIVVARRTVTKYREMLSIPSSTDRKKA